MPGFSKQAPHVDKHEACHLCTFKCDTKEELAKHSTEVHQNQQKGDHSDNPILSEFKGEKGRLSHVKFRKLLQTNDLVEVVVPGNGFCFLSTLLIALGKQGISTDMSNISIEVMNEIKSNIKLYQEVFPFDSAEEILKTCEAFFQQGIYSHDYVDFCIEASANAMGVNIHVFQKVTYRVTMTSIKCNKFVSVIDLFCMFHKCKNSTNNLDCHYNSYVKSQYLKTHKEEIESTFVLSPEEEAERDS